MDWLGDLASSATSARDIVLGLAAIVGIVVGALTWIDRRIDTRLAPLMTQMTTVLAELKSVRHHQREIARHVGLDTFDDD